MFYLRNVNGTDKSLAKHRPNYYRIEQWRKQASFEERKERRKDRRDIFTAKGKSLFWVHGFSSK